MVLESVYLGHTRPSLEPDPWAGHRVLPGRPGALSVIRTIIPAPKPVKPSGKGPFPPPPQFTHSPAHYADSSPATPPEPHGVSDDDSPPERTPDRADWGGRRPDVRAGRTVVGGWSGKCAAADTPPPGDRPPTAGCRSPGAGLRAGPRRGSGGWGEGQGCRPAAGGSPAPQGPHRSNRHYACSLLRPRVRLFSLAWIVSKSSCKAGSPNQLFRSLV